MQALMIIGGLARIRAKWEKIANYGKPVAKRSDKG